MRFDALVVLGCSVHEGRLSDAALRRVDRAARAYREHGAAVVIASGGKTWQGFREADVFAQGLCERGVPSERVLRERQSLTTQGNARGVQRLLYEKQLCSLGLVTCDWHMQRALHLFARLGLPLTPLPAVSPPLSPRSAGARWLRERGSLVLDLAMIRLGIIE